MEKDAVETLVFMSSPKNSSYHNRPSVLRTPLRQGLARRGMTEREVESMLDGISGGESSSSSGEEEDEGGRVRLRG